MPTENIKNRRLENKFTVVIGANGAGKSHLLGSIAHQFRRETKGLTSWELRFDQDKAPGSFPDNTSLLAISNLVQDSFPYDTGTIGGYKYLGLRGATNNVFTGSLAQTTCDSLLDFEGTPAKLEWIQPLLSEIQMTKFGFTFEAANKAEISKPNVIYRISEILEKPKGTRSALISQLLDSANVEISGLAQDVEEAIRHFGIDEEDSFKFGRSIEKVLDMSYKYEVSPSKISQLFRILSLGKVESTFTGKYGTFNFTSLSAGQQIIISTFARIVANIEPGALVLIDEPESGLHPNWQHRYIPLLNESIPSNYRCHFVIATHSPYIVSDGSDLLVPGAKWGDFVQFDEPFQGRSVENILYRVFRARISGNSLVQDDLQILLEYIAGLGDFPDAEVARSLRRLEILSGPDTKDLNDVIGQVRELLGSGEN